MKRFIFNAVLSGMGNSMEEGWNDAIEQFYNDPGMPDSESTVVEDEEEKKEDKEERL